MGYGNKGVKQRTATSGGFDAGCFASRSPAAAAATAAHDAVSAAAAAAAISVRGEK